MTELKPENEAPGVITDHEFFPADDNPYLCGYTYQPEVLGRATNASNGEMVDVALGNRKGCRLAEAAHTVAKKPYTIPETSKYRCINCVTQNVDPCVHGPGSV